jgi:hypothetical protein
MLVMVSPFLGSAVELFAAPDRRPGKGREQIPRLERICLPGLIGVSEGRAGLGSRE